MRNPAFSALLERMASLHDSKNADYAADGDPLSNFRQAGAVAEGFTGADAVFASLIGVKLARLRELTANKKTPNHESIADTRIDLAMYAALWASYHVAEPSTVVLDSGTRGHYDDRQANARPCARCQRKSVTRPCTGAGPCPYDRKR